MLNSRVAGAPPSDSLVRMLGGFAVALALGSTAGAVFESRPERRWQREPSDIITDGALMFLFPFIGATIALVVVGKLIFGASFLCTALGLTTFEWWFHTNLWRLTLAGVGVLLAVTAGLFLYFRRRAPKWETQTDTLLQAFRA